MAGPADIMAAVSRKYDIQQQQADSEGRLRQAQGEGITGALPSENALRMAQAGEAGERAKTIGPTAQASIASTMAGIPETQARTAYMGAQTRTLNDMTAPGGEALGRWWLSQLPPGTVRPDPVRPISKLAAPRPDVTSGGVGDDAHIGGGTGMVGLYAGGTPNVPAPGQTITGGSWEGPQSNGPAPAPLPPPATTGSELRRRLGLGVVKAYAGGTPNVPAPGQTITGGSWEGPQSNGPAPAPLPPPATTGTDLRRRLGLGVVRAAAGDPNVQPARNVPAGAPPVAMPTPPGTPDTPSFGTRRSLAAYADGTDSVGGTSDGTTHVDMIGGSGISGGVYTPPGTAQAQSQRLLATQGPQAYAAMHDAGASMGGGVAHPGPHIMDIEPGSLPSGSYSNDGKIHFEGGQPHARGTSRIQKGKGQARPPMPAPTAPAPGGPPPSGPGGSPMPSLMQALNAAMGAPQVPGRRPPPGTPQDTVPAELTPGEAVLTPGAAQHMGRGTIAALNAQHPPAGPAGAPGEPTPGRGMPTRKPPAHKGHQVHVHIHMGK